MSKDKGMVLCGKPGIAKVYWPGGPAKYQCDEHAFVIKRLAVVMGFHVVIERADGSEPCSHQVKAGAGQEAGDGLEAR